MNAQQAIRKIKKSKPKTIKEFKDLGLPLQREGSGVFRHVMRVKGLPLAVKFPQTMGDTKAAFRAGKMHSTVEVRKIKKLSRITWMRKYLPKVYYHDKRSGILVMSWHSEFNSIADAFRALGQLTTRLIRKYQNVSIDDLHEENVRQGADRKKIIFVDLGY